MQVRGHGDLLSAEHCLAQGRPFPSRLPLAWLIKQVLAGPPGRRADVVDITAGWQSSSTRSVPRVTGSDGFLRPWARPRCKPPPARFGAGQAWPVPLAAACWLGEPVAAPVRVSR
jgi:hypothetical protein